ncbi:MAG: 6-carboxytetrahydropterin synthase [Piscinibacter sp.]|uniref:6-pyruvoyl trahydropterin synthase family protein n=1 Tax=Piscinibacter sp. TaxID=1903157 RepID=UPI002584CEC6|nr:6-carboxytetrahydropterin synthase [Piscinibacter sp.]MCW5667868.1 6-carboxytetrahydropterin synthase [Piscinibacter sp.]
MIYELSQQFFFEAAHTLDREIDTASSKRIHGHTYHAEVSVRGTRNPHTGMVVDLGLLRREIDRIRSVLDHAFLDEIEGLGKPTLENLSGFIANQFVNFDPPISSVRVWREASGDSCRLTLRAVAS